MNLVDNPYTNLPVQDIVHPDHGRPHVEEARGQFPPQMEGAVGGQTEEDAITSSEGELEVPNEKGPDHAATATQVGNNNYLEVSLEGDNIRAQQVGRSNTFTASSGPSIRGYELTVKTPDTDYELCVEIKKHIDDNIDNINISLKPHNASVESTSLGSVIIRVAVEPGTKLGPVWLREVITKILSQDIIAKLPKGTRMEVNFSASLPLTPLDVDIFGENEATHWMTEYTSDIHRKDETGRSMLHHAARIGNRAAIIFSLKSGCLVNDQDCQGNTPLHYAAMSGQTGVSVSRLLVEGGASIDVVNSDGCTPLHIAVTERNLETVELFAKMFGAKESNPTANQKIEISSLIHLLVKQGADVNALNRQNLTPLQVAASSQRFDVIVALLTEGADANVVHKSCQTPLHCVYGLNKPNWKIEDITEAYRLKKHLTVNPVTPSSVLDIPDSEGNTPLQSALNSNFTPAAIILLNAGANANTKNKERDTPLHTVAGNTNIENTTTEHDAVVKIIECSRDVNVTDKQGNTPLMLAVEKNKNISPLLKAGADVNAQNIHGDTPLMIAVKHNSRVMVETLLDAGSDVCTSNTQEDTALMIAVDNACNKSVSTLLAYGANVNASNTRGETVLHKAAKTPLRTSFDKGADLNLEASVLSCDVIIEGGTGYSTLRSDDKQSNYTPSNVISELIQAGADVNAKDVDGNTPMMVAVKLGIANNVETLLGAGADVEAKDVGGNTPLIKATQKRLTTIVSLLLNAGADVNAKGDKGTIPLIVAIQTPYLSISEVKEKDKFIQQLMAGGAHVNATDSGGNTPLIEALKTGRDISPLLTAGAHVNAKDADGNTPLLMALRRGRDISPLLKAGAHANAKDADGNTSLMMAVEGGCDISPLLKAGAHANSKNGSGKTALHFVSKLKTHWNIYRYKKEIENYTSQLTAAGADVNAQDKDGNTPLHIGVMNHDYPFVRDLLRNVQADVNITNGFGQSALHLAVDKERSPDYENRQQRMQEKIIRAILDRLPNLNVKDNDGRTALDIAKMSHNIFLVELLKSKNNTSNPRQTSQTQC